MRKILFDINQGKVNKEISLDFSITSKKFTEYLMTNFTKYFDRTRGIGCLRIFISDNDLLPNEGKLGLDPEKDRRDLKVIGILIYWINIDISNWLEYSIEQKFEIIKALWIRFFKDLPQIVYVEEKEKIIEEFEKLEMSQIL